MRFGFSTLLLVIVLFGAGYLYYQASAGCGVPIAYRVGDIDPRFNLSYEEVRTYISNAESMWEDATGRNLFTYDESAKFSINFVFDGRQADSNAESYLRDTLEDREWESQSVRVQYENLVNKYETLKSNYEKQSATYENKLRAYNVEVEKWNIAGGAPETVYTALSKKQQYLKEEQDRLNSIASELNLLVKEMNKIGNEGNLIVDDYNNVVEEYNNRFTEGGEFIQGDYNGDVINIYEYQSSEELEIVLAHEFGHTLSIEHVEGKESIMYHLMEYQSLENGVTANDVEAFQNTCGNERATLWSVL